MWELQWSWSIVFLWAVKCLYQCAHVCACMVLGMQTPSLPSVASLGQTITTHQGKQLGMTQISLLCDCVPMFGLLEPNLTHFVHTVEENWGHALQFWWAPRAFPARLTHGSCVADALALVSYPAEWDTGCNEQGTWGNNGEQVAGGSGGEW